MDRIALSKRIKGLSEVFASDNVLAQDLGAMAYVLENMSDEKFACIVNKELDTDEESKESNELLGIPGNNGPSYTPATRPSKVNKTEVGKLNKDLSNEMLGEMIADLNSGMSTSEIKMKWNKRAPGIMKGEPTPEAVPTAVMSNEEKDTEEEKEKEDMSDVTGMYWNKAASEAVAEALLKDVVGMDKSICCDTKRHLDKEQMSDSQKKQETPPTLKGEQIPMNKENHDSGIVEKAKAAKPVNKSAAEESSDADKEEQEAIDKIEEGLEDLKKVDKEENEDSEEKAIEEIEDAVEDLKENEEEDKDEDKDEEDEDKDEEDKEASVVDSSVIQSEGVELIAPMSEVKLSSDEEAELGKLFD